MRERGQPGVRSWGFLATVLVVSALALAPAVTVAANPSVSVSSAAVSPGESATVAVVLESAPNGLASYNITVSLSGSGVATIENIRYPQKFGRIEYPQFADDGSAVTMEAADTDRHVESGASGVVLAKLRVEGQSAGEEQLSVSIHRLADDDGATITDQTTPGSLTVDGDGDGSGSTADGDDGGDETTGNQDDRATTTDVTDSGVTEATDAIQATDTGGRATATSGEPEVPSDDGARGSTTTDRGTAATGDDGTESDGSSEASVTETGAGDDAESDGLAGGAVTVSFDELDGPTVGLIVGLVLPVAFFGFVIVVVVR